MKVLLVDAGNSRLKWRLVEGATALAEGVLDNARAGELGARVAAQPGRVLVANVAGAARERALRELCAGWAVEPEFLQSAAAQCGVRNGYESPEKLGCDRWAALIAAWRLRREACLVINCGTATTVDALSASGEFLGGLILPGLELMRRSLYGGTAGLRPEAGSFREFPRNTADAIATGAVLATAGAIRLQHARLGRADAPCVLGGGAAEVLAPHLGLAVARVDDLVLQGLQWMAQEGR